MTDNQSCQNRTGLTAAECEPLNVVDLVNAALDVSTIDPYDEAEYRQRMLELATMLDEINNGGTDYFDWTWGETGP